MARFPVFFFFFFNDTATTEIYTLSLHDALPILLMPNRLGHSVVTVTVLPTSQPVRSEEHTSELQSQSNLVCRLLLEKKKRKHRLAATGEVEAIAARGIAAALGTVLILRSNQHDR